MSLQMITSLDNLANTAVQKNNTVEKLVVTNKQLTDTIMKLQEDNAKLLTFIQQMAGHNPRRTQQQSSTPQWDPKGDCHTHGNKVMMGHNNKACKCKNPGHQDEATRQNTMEGNQDIRTGNPSDGAQQQG
ncbi:hypothetical protein ACHAW6_004260 [Cyclotella cf. meneghiniana]